MGEPLAISILRKKRDRIRDTIVKYKARLKEAQADLAHVIAALRLFEIDNNADDFPAYVDLNRVFRRGETTSFCMAALEAEGPLDIFLAGAMGTSVAMLERYYADADPKRKASAFSGITYKPPRVLGTGNDGIAARKKKSIDF